MNAWATVHTLGFGVDSIQIVLGIPPHIYRYLARGGFHDPAAIPLCQLSFPRGRRRGQGVPGRMNRAVPWCGERLGGGVFVSRAPTRHHPSYSDEVKRLHGVVVESDVVAGWLAVRVEICGCRSPIQRARLAPFCGWWVGGGCTHHQCEHHVHTDQHWSRGGWGARGRHSGGC
jgi:hypothetical protein